MRTYNYVGINSAIYQMMLSQIVLHPDSKGTYILMHVDMYVCMYVHMYVYMYDVRMYVYMYDVHM